MVLDVMIEVAVVVCPEELLTTGVAAALFYAAAEGTGTTFDLIYVFEEEEEVVEVETLESVVLAFC